MWLRVGGVLSSLSPWRVAVPAACCVWLARARTRGLVVAYRTAAATASQPHFLWSSGRGEVRRRPCELPSPPCVARRAGAPSAMHQLGELAQKTLALHPTSAGSAISSTDFVGSSSPPIFSYLKCSDCGCPSTRTRQSVRAQTWPFWGCTHRPSSTSTSRPRLRRGATGGARPPGEALSGTLLRGGGPRG